MSIMSETTYRKLWPRRSSEIKLQDYSRGTIPVVGCTQTEVSYADQTATLPLVVVKGTGPTLLGRNWLHKIKLDWGKIHYTPSASLQDLLGKYEESSRRVWVL